MVPDAVDWLVRLQPVIQNNLFPFSGTRVCVPHDEPLHADVIGDEEAPQRRRK